MPEVKQPNSSKFQNILYEYASEFSSTRKGEIFCKFCDCLMKSDKRFMVEVRGSFHETENRKTFLKNALPDFAGQINYFLFHFKPIGLFSNTGL